MEAIEPREGELWLIRSRKPGGPRAIVCVLLVDRAIVSTAFTDSESEPATDQDLCFARGEAAPWTVRLSCDLVGPVSIGSFIRRVGRIPLPPEILRPATEEGEFDTSLAGRRGIPLRGPGDPRWAETEARVDEMRRHFLTPFEG